MYHSSYHFHMICLFLFELKHPVPFVIAGFPEEKFESNFRVRCGGFVALSEPLRTTAKSAARAARALWRNFQSASM